MEADVQRPTESRGVFCEPCLDRAGYMTMKIVDHRGVTIAFGCMPAEWCDAEMVMVAQERLARADPDYEHPPFFDLLTPLGPSADVLPFPVQADERRASGPRLVPADQMDVA